MNKQLKELYYGQDIRFPIIGAVIEGNAEGNIYCDNNRAPRHIFVVSKFGFCQEIYSEYNISFFEQIKNIIESINRKKLRMYNPCNATKEYLEKNIYAKESKRKRYVFEGNVALKTENQCNYTIRPMYQKDIQKEDFGLELSSRYYRNSEDFILNAMPLVACDKNGICMGIIYSAGNDKNMSEIDIYVHKEYRKQGIAAQLVKDFINECQKNNKIAVWDCYADLIESYHLAEKSGFSLKKEYCFINIERPKENEIKE